MRIEKLEPSRHKQGRWLVWLEDGSLLRVGEGDVVSLGLHTGKELTEAQGQALVEAQARNRMEGRAAALLTGRPMSRKELEDRLSTPPRRRSGPGEGREADLEVLERERAQLREQARRTADRMEDLGLLDDGAYAEVVVRHYAAKGYGARKIRDELYRRGVPRALWDGALAQVEDQGPRLDELVRRRLRGGQPTREELKKTSDYLARRGFSWEAIGQALERYRSWED